MASRTGERSCPSCGKSFAEGNRCPDDGTALVMVAREPVGDPLVGLEIDGRYTIRGKLGQGGMGTVYRAWQHSVGREVALKVMSAPDPDGMLAKRFMREANLLGQLNQPGIVAMLDFGQLADGKLYLTMELVDGETLSALIKREGPLSVARVKRIGVQLCDVLEAAHHRGIVHRDLKPANLMILRSPPGRDHLKVLDFGLARSLSDPERLTESGQVVGSAQFMAPELAGGDDATALSDLYAVGAILYCAATSRLPFGKPAGFTEAVRRQLGGRVEPFERPLPATLERLILRLLDVEPTNRPGSAALVREMLLAIDEHYDAAPPPAPLPNDLASPTGLLPARTSARPPALKLGMVLGFALVLGGGGSWWLVNSRTGPLPEFAPPQLTRDASSNAPLPGPGPSIDAVVADAGVAGVGVADAGVADAGVADAGVSDAGAADAGRVDAGVRRPVRKPKPPRRGVDAGEAGDWL